MNAVTIKVFGAFRKYVPSGELKINLDSELSVPAIKERIAKEIRAIAPGFNDEGLIADSALGNAQGIFSESQTLTSLQGEEVLALLPPVCGG